MRWVPRSRQSRDTVLLRSHSGARSPERSAALMPRWRRFRRRAYRCCRGAAWGLLPIPARVMSELMLDAAGRRRSPATLPEFHAGRPPRNKGMRYPADPPTIEEIVTVMRRAGDTVHGARLRGLIVVLWRAGLRIHEALALAEADLDARRGPLLVRRGEGGRRREVGMDGWEWGQRALAPGASGAVGRQRRDHRHRPRPPRADRPGRQLARVMTPRPGGGEAATSSPPVQVQIASQEPGVASGPQGAPSIAKQQQAWRKRPACLRSRKEHSRSDMAELRKQARATLCVAQSRVSDELSGRCVRGDHLDDQLSDPTRLLIEREVTRVGDRDDGHVRALLERPPFVVG